MSRRRLREENGNEQPTRSVRARREEYQPEDARADIDYYAMGTHAAQVGDTALAIYAAKQEPNALSYVLTEAAKVGNMDIIRALYTPGNSGQLTAITRGAAEGGQRELIAEALRQGAIYEDVAWGAARGGQMALLQEILQQNPSLNRTNFIFPATIGGQLNVIQYLFDPRYRRLGTQDIIIYGAQLGRRDIVDWALANVYRNESTDVVHDALTRALGAAVNAGQLDIANYLISRGADINYASMTAVESGQLGNVAWVISRGATNYAEMLDVAIDYGYDHIASYIRDNYLGDNMMINGINE